MDQTNTTEVVAEYKGIEVLRAPMLSERMIASISAGLYEQNEIACGLAVIPRGARLLEMGAGAGIVGAVLARALDLEAVVSIEANPTLLPHIRRMHAHNGLDHVIDLRHGVVITAPTTEDTVTFHVAGNFLGSSMIERAEKRTTAVEVPVLRYDALRAEFPHNAIMMDIEGAELEFLRHADLSGIDVLVMELHRGFYGREGIHECHRLCKEAGLRHEKEISQATVHVFRRR